MAIPNFPELERQILADWKEKDIFGQTLRKPSPRGRFVFFDGPPTANGMPHIGHVETRAFKDIIPRFKTMQGYMVERKAGWDTQGLPVEIEVEKLLGISGKNQIEAYGVEKFNALARTSVWKYKELWEKMTERIGFWLDLEHPYITYSNDYIESLWWIFKQAWDQKLLEQDFKVIPYCPRCGTALSSHEVAQGYQLVKEPSVYIKFELVDEPGTYILAWTTTPWTLPGNVALAVKADIDYVKIDSKSQGEKLILARSLAERVLADDPDLVVHLNNAISFKGTELVGMKYKPLFDFIDLREVASPSTPAASGATPSRVMLGTGSQAGGDISNTYTIVPADFVTTEDGTGVVHTAVMYGIEDFELGKKLGLPTVHTVDLQGKFNELVTPWVGREVKDAAGETQQLVIDWLREHNRLYKVEAYEHDYPFCWRCKHALLYYAKTTWFIRMTTLQDELIANNDTINWYPKHIKDGRFGEWLREVKDWAISRERYWGTPLPIWTCDECKHQECFGGYQELLDRLPTRNTYIFVRHGESVLNVERILNTEVANKDTYELTAAGRAQAEAGVKSLEGVHVDAIYSSQFRRARETANIYSQVLGVPVTESAMINEYHIGPEFEGKSIAAFHEHFGDRAKRVDDAPPGGETWKDIRTRMVKFLTELDAQSVGKTYVIVTHADPILVTKWAVSLQSVPSLTRFEDVPYGVPEEQKFHSGILQADGSFDPHRPYVDAISFPCATCGSTSLPTDQPHSRSSTAGHLPSGRGGQMRRTPEVADTWFDSGSMPFAQWHYPFENQERIDGNLSYPADFISEAIDQTRGWFYTLLAVATILQKAKVVKQAPFKNVVVLGFVMDAKGKKLSKSDGNYVDPMEMIEKFGADAVRWFLYSTNQPWDEKNFDPKVVDEGVKKTFLILMNVLSFWQLYPQTTVADSARAKNPLDRWVLTLLDQLVVGVTEDLEQYRITSAARRLADFITELSTWYVRRSRDRFKDAKSNSLTTSHEGDEASMASAVLGHVLKSLSMLMAPFTPFLAEHLYHAVGGKLSSVHLETWPTAGTVDEKLLVDMALARTVVEQALSLRAAAGIKIRQPLQQLVVSTALRPDLDEIVQQELNVKELHSATTLPTGTEWATGETVALDITISDDLREEGYARDLAREVNALRKKAGLKPSDSIIVHCEPNTIIAKIIERFGEQFLKDVRARAATPSMDGATMTGELTLDAPGLIGISVV